MQMFINVKICEFKICVFEIPGKFCKRPAKFKNSFLMKIFAVKQKSHDTRRVL